MYVLRATLSEPDAADSKFEVDIVHDGLPRKET